MMPREPDLLYMGELEELVLLAILKIGPNAYGVPIQEALEEAGRKLSVGALYATLDRLLRKGFITAWQGDPTAERGGRSKRYYRLEAAGMGALRRTEQSRQTLRTPLTGREEGLASCLGY